MTEKKERKKKIAIDPMIEKPIETKDVSRFKESEKKKVREYISMFSESMFKGRMITSEAYKMLKTAKEYGITIPDNIKHLIP